MRFLILIIIVTVFNSFSFGQTSYGYVERDAESQVDWSEVGRNFSDMLQQKAYEREAKIEALKKLPSIAIKHLHEYTELTGNKIKDDKIIALFNKAFDKIESIENDFWSGQNGYRGISASDKYVSDLQDIISVTEREYLRILRGF